MKLKIIKRTFLLVCKFVLYTFCATLARSPDPDSPDRIKPNRLATPAHLLHPGGCQDRGIKSPAHHPISSWHKKATNLPGESKSIMFLFDLSAQRHFRGVRAEKDSNGKELPGSTYSYLAEIKNSQETKDDTDKVD